MGEVYDKPREELTAAEKERSLRYQIMDVVDQIRWIPGFGYERELDWLRTMADWMICKKRYWGLALPIWECASCGSVRGDRRARRAAASAPSRAGKSSRATRPTGRTSTRSRSRAPNAAARRRASPTSATRGSTPASCPSRRCTTGPSPTTGRNGSRPTSSPSRSRASSATGSTRLLAMSTVLRREAAVQVAPRLRHPVRRGRPPDAQELGQRDRVQRGRRADRRRRDALDVRRARDPRTTSSSATTPPTRRAASCWSCGTSTSSSCHLARLAGWHPVTSAAAPPRRRAAGARPLDQVAHRRHCRTTWPSGCADFDTLGAHAPSAAFIDDLSTWYLRRSRERFAADGRPPTRRLPSRTLHAALATTCAHDGADPALPVRGDLREPGRPAWTTGCRRQRPYVRVSHRLDAALRDEPLEASMAIARRAVDLVRTLRSQAGLRTRQPLARMWLAPAGAADRAKRRCSRSLARRGQRQGASSCIGDESELVERRVKPLLPQDRPAPRRRNTGRCWPPRERTRSSTWPTAASRLAGVELAADEVEILATPRPGHGRRP